MSTENLSPQNSPPVVEVEQDVIVVTTPEKSPVDEQITTDTAVSEGQATPSTSSRVTSRSPPPGTINMTALRANLPDIELNSPATNIIGTPFAHTTTNTPFEYPFPETSGDSTSSPPSHPSFRPGSPHGSFHPPPHPLPQADVHPPGSSSFNLIHPKFRAPEPVSPPPMPPSLKKKRWSLSFLNRRRTSTPSTPTGDGPSSPLGVPPAVTSGSVLSGLGSGRPRQGSRGASGSKQNDDLKRSIDQN